MIWGFKAEEKKWYYKCMWELDTLNNHVFKSIFKNSLAFEFVHKPEISDNKKKMRIEFSWNKLVFSVLILFCSSFVNSLSKSFRYYIFSFLEFYPTHTHIHAHILLPLSKYYYLLYPNIITRNTFFFFPSQVLTLNYFSIF
jgi:hypothetical protein